MNLEVDYIIVGQGIAGSFVAHNLEKRNKTFIIIDELQGETSSTKATGLINPITGRRFVKSWKIDELIPFAQETYEELELKFSCKLIEKTKVHRILQSVEQQNDWASKTKEDRYQLYLKNTALIHHDEALINNPFGFIEIEPVYKVNTPLLIEKFTDYYLSKNYLLKSKFEYNELIIKDSFVQYKNIKAKQIIFCEGHLAIENPYFSYLPFLLSKGEVVVFESKELPEDFILGGSTNITPLGNHLFSIGATYAWNDVSLETTEAKKNELLEKLENIINCDYTVKHQKAGVRPTVKDRRPLLGAHPEYQNLLIFNGMGTKGLSLAPYFADYFIDALENNLDISLEVSIERFTS